MHATLVSFSVIWGKICNSCLVFIGQKCLFRRYLRRGRGRWAYLTYSIFHGALKDANFAIFYLRSLRIMKQPVFPFS